MAMRSKVFTYQAELQWQGGRTATVASGDRPQLPVAPPEDFPDGQADRWSPEHLFLGALESCTMLSFLAHCEHRRRARSSAAPTITATRSPTSTWWCACAWRRARRPLPGA